MPLPAVQGILRGVDAPESPELPSCPTLQSSEGDNVWDQLSSSTGITTPQDICKGSRETPTPWGSRMELPATNGPVAGAGTEAEVKVGVTAQGDSSPAQAWGSGRLGLESSCEERRKCLPGAAPASGRGDSSSSSTTEV